MEISQHDYARACGCCVETAGRRLRSATYRSGPRGTRLYNLAEALPTVRPREIAKGAIPALLSAATPPEDTLYVGGVEAAEVARRLIEWLPDDARTRLSKVQNFFVVSVANSNVCAAPVVENLELLRVLIGLQPDVLKFVFRAGDVPDMDRMSPAFAICNYTTTTKEAA
ncbi:hypothetical protein FIU85_01390 [Roseovarius sp. THAF8]|nr:hypothetical protein FIU85_01390 [Roseovarius sp. THAF8]